MNPRIIIAGSRWATYWETRVAVLSCPWFEMAVVSRAGRRGGAPGVQLTIVSGTASGADTHGESVAVACGWEIKRFPADWRRLGKRAGFARNTQMAEFAAAALPYAGLIAVWDGRIAGTAQMISEAFRLGLWVHVFDTRSRKPVTMAEQPAYVAKYGRPSPQPFPKHLILGA